MTELLFKSNLYCMKESKNKTEVKATNERKKILFIYPPAPVMNREDRCQQPTKELLVIPPLPPMDLMYMASVAEGLGLEAKIKDYSLSHVEKLEGLKVERKNETKTIQPFNHSTIQLASNLKSLNPDYLVINAASTTFESDLSVLETAKEICPNIITIAKGAHFLTENTDILYKYKALDLIIIGEPEQTLKEILKGKPYSEIKGLCYRDGFIAKYTGKRPFIKDLDKLPFPARHLVNNKLYRRPDNNKVQALIKVSRGCPYHCFFCLATPVAGAKVRLRSAENIIEEIKECVYKYKIRNFVFWSDIFNQDYDWTMDLCEKIIDSGLDITWSCNTRADTVDEDMAELMYEAGCRMVSIGVESGSQYILDKIGKKITIEQIMRTVKIFKKSKIKIYNYFVIGLPWDNENTIEETIEFAIALNSDFVNFYTAVPLPGTRFYRFAKENNLLDENACWSGAYYSPIINTMCLSKERIFELHKQAVKRFYLRPKYILKMIASIRSLAEVINYTKAGFGLLFRR